MFLDNWLAMKCDAVPNSGDALLLIRDKIQLLLLLREAWPVSKCWVLNNVESIP